MIDKALELTHVVKYLIGPSALIKYPGGCIDFKLDCGWDSPRANREIPEVETNVEQIRAILTTGTFSAWRSLFFYRCTDDISFASLTPEGVVNLDPGHIDDNTVGMALPPCSPKITNLLANLLRIEPLSHASSADIRNKVSPEVVKELHLWLDTTQKEVMETSNERFIPGLRDPRLISLINEKIGRISTESPSHLVGVLRLGLKKSVESKKQFVGATLRCYSESCRRRTTLLLYSSLGQGGRCPYCNSSDVYCSGCLRTKMGLDCPSKCEYCQKYFL